MPNELKLKQLAAQKSHQKPKKSKRVPLEKKTSQQLIKHVDEAFSKYIRIRDSVRAGDRFEGECITCSRPLIVKTDDGRWVASSQNGHFISRGVMSLRFDEENCNLQCAHCNAWMDKEEMLERYRKALDLKYGDGTATKLKRISKHPDAYKRPSKDELLQIIHDCKEQVTYYETH